MRVFGRQMLRLLALVVLVALLVGVPVVIVVMVRIPQPSLDRWRDAWQTHRLDLDLVVQAGVLLFGVLWTWFAATAVIELVRVLPHRHDPSALQRTSGAGPGGWVRGLVRFMAISSVGAGLVAGSVPGVGFAESTSRVVHTVVPGDSYWEIAEGHLHETLGRDATGHEVFELTEVLIEQNAPRLGHHDPTLLLPGETVVVVEVSPAASTEVSPATVVEPSVAPGAVSAASTPDTPVAASVFTPAVSAPEGATDDAASIDTSVPPSVPPSVSSVASAADGSSSWPGLGGAVFLATAAVAAIEGRRRLRLRAGRPMSRLDSPTFAQARTELLLRSLDDRERLVRLDLAVRAASCDLASQGASILATSVSEAGDVRLHLRGAAVPSSLRWRLDVHTSTWRLSASVPLEELAAMVGDGVFPCPTLVQLGRLDDGDDLYVDVEAFGSIAVPADVAPALAASLALSPFRTTAAIRCVGVVGVEGLHGVATFPGSEATSVVERARAGGSSVASWASGGTTFALRAQSADGESWDPEVVIVGTADGPPVSVVDVPGGAGIALIVPESWKASAWLRREGDRFVFEPLGLAIAPVAVEVDALAAITDLVTLQEDPLPEVSPPMGFAAARDEVEFVEPEWDLLVRMIGQVEVISPDGRVAQFVRSKSLELVVWMALHRERPTRSGARTDLWEVGVRSATFANVVSEARRALAELRLPPDGEDWIGRTLTDDLPLHPRILTDGDLLQARLEASRGLSHAAAIHVLQPGLELITGLPFSSPCFAWVDAQGQTSSLVLLATAAATELAGHHLALGDVDGVFWATGQGLKVLAGHEELIALRMRAHASRGDLAGVRLEWEQYERALAADTWSPGEPSPKLVSLRRELLASPLAVTSGV